MGKPARVISLVIGVTLTIVGSSGCSTVEFYEKELLADPSMVFETDPSEVHFQQKVFYSMEGSAGGIGESAGGGCGCY